MNLEKLFDIKHADTLLNLKIEEDCYFYRQVGLGSPICLACVNKMLTERKKKAKAKKSTWREKDTDKCLLILHRHSQQQGTHNSALDLWRKPRRAITFTMCVSWKSQFVNITRRERKDFVVTKLVVSCEQRRVEHEKFWSNSSGCSGEPR